MVPFLAKVKQICSIFTLLWLQEHDGFRSFAPNSPHYALDVHIPTFSRSNILRYVVPQFGAYELRMDLPPLGLVVLVPGSPSMGSVSHLEISFQRFR